MKLWKGAILVFILISTALSLLLTKTMRPAGSANPWASQTSIQPSSAAVPSGPASLPSSSSSSSLSSSSSSSSSSSLPRAAGLRRVARSMEGMGTLLSEFSYMFQSFTEGELRKLIRMLMDKKTRRSGRVGTSGRGRRTKRARGPNLCKLHHKELTVSDLGLGYDSNETVLFSYCSGKCTNRRRNYDMVLEHMRLNKPDRQKGKSRKSFKRDHEHYGPCCRPTKYENETAFLDNNSRFFVIKNVSAKACGCV